MTEATETKSSDRIIVGVDGSPESVKALRAGARMSQALGAPLEAIITWEFPVMMDAYYPIPDWSPEEDAKKALLETVTEALGDPPSVKLRLTARQGSPGRTLIEESKNAAMVVVGSRGRGGFKGLLLGSVSSAVASHAHCPVLIIHDKDKDVD